MDVQRVVRPQVSGAYEELVLEALARRLATYTRGAFVGPHEALGILQEEVDEAWEAVREARHGPGLLAPDSTRLADELLDIAVAAVWGVASLCATGRADHGLLRPEGPWKKGPGHATNGLTEGPCSRCGASSRADLGLACPCDPWTDAGRAEAQRRLNLKPMPLAGGRALEVVLDEHVRPGHAIAVDLSHVRPAQHQLEAPGGLTVQQQDLLVCTACGAEGTDQEAMALPCPGKRAPGASAP